jgi:hypothetical protein
MSLARLYLGKPQYTRELLAPIYGQGFDKRDLRVTKPF